MERHNGRPGTVVSERECAGAGSRPRGKRPLPPEWPPLGPSQFAIHYAFGTEAHARQLLYNVSRMLKPRGLFIGTAGPRRLTPLLPPEIP